MEWNRMDWHHIMEGSGTQLPTDLAEERPDLAARGVAGLERDDRVARDRLEVLVLVELGLWRGEQS